ncbi:MAG TPA: GTPase domain-containing protein [Thermoplasmata archaeon]|nr:GTPase domain-containing protein [Thermoplasmata archaeon]
MPAVKVTTRTRRPAGAKREMKRGPDTARIAVVGIPASGKTTYFRFLSGHFGLNLPILYIPARVDNGTMPLYGDLENDVALEETTYETTDPTDPEGSLETTTRYYVNRPMEDRRKLWVELSAGREDQGILTKYPLPTKFNQFVEMKLRFRYGAADGDAGSRPMELQTIDEAGGIIADYFTYDRLWLDSTDAEVSEKSCRVIPHFDSWRPDRRDLWRRGLTLLGRFVQEADAIILLLAPGLPSLRDQAQQVNLARGVFRYVRARNLPLVIAISKSDKLNEFYGEVEQSVRDRTFRSAFDPVDFLLRRDGAGMGTILVAQEGRGISVKEDVYLIASAVSTGEGHPLFIGETGQEAPTSGTTTLGVPVMVNTTLPLARACERILALRATKGS